MANISPGVVKSPSEAIKVAVRFRSRKEGSAFYWKPKNDQCVVSKDSKPNDKQYLFDRVFNETENNNIVYHDVGKEVIESAMQGFNSTIFAYGQTASGKTHTMMGPKVGKEDGLIPQGIREIFEHIEKSKDKQFLLRVSYIEIYNENVYDLFAEEKDRTKDLVIRDDEKGNTNMDELIEAQISSKDELMDLMNEGEKQRHVGITDMNDRSSRSHTIFRIIIESLEVGIDESDDTGKAVKVSHLNLVDLAGSERAKQTGAAGQRFKESQNINLSLMHLGKVISLLSESKPAAHIPYRNSKLTRILKNSLGGNAKTLIICTITAAEEDQTKSTLEFASRAKKIVNHAEVNEFLDDRARIKQQKDLIRELQSKLDHYQKDYETSKVERLEREMQDKEERIEDYQRKIEKLQKEFINNKFIKLFNEQHKDPPRKMKNNRRATMCATLAKPSRKSFGGALGFERTRKEMLEFRCPQFNPSNDSLHDFGENIESKPPSMNVPLTDKIEKDAKNVNGLELDIDVQTDQEQQSTPNDHLSEMEIQSKSNLEMENNKLRNEILQLKQQISSMDKGIASNVNKMSKSRLSDDCVDKRPRRQRGGKSVRFFESPSQDIIPEEHEINSMNAFPEEETMDESWLTSGLQTSSQRSNESNYADDNKFINDDEQETARSNNVQLYEIERVLSSMQVDCFDIKARANVLHEQLLKSRGITNTSLNLSIIEDVEKQDEDKKVDISLIPTSGKKTESSEESTRIELEHQLELFRTSTQEKDELISQLKSKIDLINSTQRHSTEQVSNDPSPEPNNEKLGSNELKDEELVRMKQEIIDAIAAKDEKEDENLQLQHELKILKGEIKGMLSSNHTSNTFEAENEDLRKQINHLKSLEEKNKLLAFELDEKEIIIDSYTTESEEMTKKNEHFQTEIEEKTKHIDKLMKELKDATSSKNVNEYESKHSELQERYSNLQEEHNSLKASMQKSNQDDYNVSDEKRQQEIQSGSEEPEPESLDKPDVAVKELEEESKVEDDSLNTNKELEQFFLEMGKKDSTLKSYEAEIEKLKSTIMELERKSEAKNVEVIPSKDENMHGEKDGSEMDNLAILNQMTQKLEDEKNINSALRQEYEEKHSLLNAKIDELLQKNSALKEEIACNTKEINNHQSESGEIFKKDSESSDKIPNSNKSFSEERNNMFDVEEKEKDNIILQLNEEIGALKKELQVLESNQSLQTKDSTNEQGGLTSNSVTKEITSHDHLDNEITEAREQDLNSILSKINAEINTKKKELDDLNDQFDQADNYRKTCDELNEEIEELKSKLANQISQAAVSRNKEVEFSALMSDYEELKKDLNDLQTVKDEWLSKAQMVEEDLKREREINSKMIEENTKSLNEKDAERERLLETISSLQEKVNNDKLEILNMKEKMDKDKQAQDELAKDANELREKLNEQMTINSQVEKNNVDDIEKLNTKIFELETCIQSLEKEKNSDIERYESITKDLANEKDLNAMIGNTNKELNAQIITFEDEISSLRETLDNKTAEIKDLKVKLDVADDEKYNHIEIAKEVARLKTELNNQMTINDKTEEEKASAVMQYDSLVQELSMKIEGLESVIESQNRKFDSVQQELANEIEVRLDIVKSNEVNTIQANNEISDLSENIKRLEDELSSGKLEIEELRDKLLVEQNHHTKLTKEVEDLSEKLDNQIMMNSKIENEKNEVIYESNLKAEELIEKVKHFEENRNDLKIDSDKLEDEMSVLKTEITEKDEEIQDLLALLEEKGEHLSKGNAEIASLGEVLKSKDVIIDDLKRSIQEGLSAMEHKEDLLNELRTENEKIKSSVTSSQESCEDQAPKDTIKKLRKDLCQKEIENASLRADQIRLQGQKDELTRKLTADADFEKGEVKRLKDEIRRLTNRAPDPDNRSRNRKDTKHVASAVATLESSFMGSSGAVHREPLQQISKQSIDNEKNKDNLFSKPASTSEKGGNENEQQKLKLTSKEKYNQAMQIFEKGSWQGAGSGIMKEDALETAKYRVQILEKEIAQRQKIEQQLRHERETYFEAGGKWKTSFKQLEYKISKRGCIDCRRFISNGTTSVGSKQE